MAAECWSHSTLRCTRSTDRRDAAWPGFHSQTTRKSMNTCVFNQFIFCFLIWSAGQFAGVMRMTSLSSSAITRWHTLARWKKLKKRGAANDQSFCREVFRSCWLMFPKSSFTHSFSSYRASTILHEVKRFETKNIHQFRYWGFSKYAPLAANWSWLYENNTYQSWSSFKPPTHKYLHL